MMVASASDLPIASPERLFPRSDMDALAKPSKNMEKPFTRRVMQVQILASTGANKFADYPKGHGRRDGR
jgi:hypothetical protein